MTGLILSNVMFNCNYCRCQISIEGLTIYMNVFLRETKLSQSHVEKILVFFVWILTIHLLNLTLTPRAHM